MTARYPEWKHSGSVFVLTTPEGANFPASAAVENFPLLVRLHKDYFDFSQAKADGADLSSSRGSRDRAPQESLVPPCNTRDPSDSSGLSGRIGPPSAGPATSKTESPRP